MDQKKRIIIENGYLSLLAASTLQTYENIWVQAFTDIGFNNRLLLVPGSGQRRHSLPRSVPGAKVNQIRSELERIIDFAGIARELPLSENAKRMYHDWYLNKAQSVHSKRLDTYALRLMTLLAANELKYEVDQDIVEKTLAICDWQLAARQMHDPVDADNEYAKMEERIRRVLGRAPRTDRQLRQFCNVKKSGLWIFHSAKSNLQNEGEVDYDPKSKQWFLERA